MKAFDHNGPTQYDLEGLTEYYTEYPMTTFRAIDDATALANTKALVVYRHSDSKDRVFDVIRDDYSFSKKD